MTAGGAAARSAAPRAVAIIGAGIRGRLHAAALGAHPGARVVAVADANIDAARALGDELGAATFGDHTELLASDTVAADAAIVATPDFAHRQVVVDLAAGGLDLMVEKPLATTLDDAVAMRNAISAAGVRCMIGYENRWNPRFSVAREHIANGALGDVRWQMAHLSDTRRVPTEMLSWAADSTPAWFLMPHSLDLLLWMSPKQVASVYATGSRGTLEAAGIDTWDAVDALLTFTDGTTATLHSNWTLPDCYPSLYDLRVELVGTAGALRIESADQGLHVYADGGLRFAQWGVYDDGDRPRGFPIDMIHAWVDWLRGSGSSEVPQADAGVRITALIDAVHASLRSGETVRAPFAEDVPG